MKTDERNVNRGLKFFKENAEKFFQLQQLTFSIDDDFGEDLQSKIKSFYKNFITLIDECNLIKWVGNSGTGINFSAFFLNSTGSGYQHFRSMQLEGEKFVIGLSDDVADIVEILFRIKDVSDRSNPITEERRLKRIEQIKKELEDCISSAVKNLVGIAKVLWPTTDENKTDLFLDILYLRDSDSDFSTKKNSALLDVIKNLDLKDLILQEDFEALQKKDKQIDQLKEQLVEKIKDEIKKEKDAKIEDLRDSLGDEASEDFTEQYRKVRQKFEHEISFFSFSFLLPKIYALRVVTYTIPVMLLAFHFCEFVTQKSNIPSWMQEICFSCSLSFQENKNDQTSSEKMDLKTIESSKAEALVPKDGVKIKKNSIQNSAKNSDGSRSDLYFHLALVTILLIAYQQLRSAISEMNIKKNLIEVYRHRELVARNFDKMRKVVDDENSKVEVIKSAAKSLFENEPSIHENRTSTVPPAFDFNFWNKG